MSDPEFDELFPTDNYVYQHDRKWNQKDDIEYVKGKFSDEEMKTLKRAFIQYGLDNNLEDNDLLQLIQDTKKSSIHGAFVEIAKSLPHRSVLSVYNQIKQKFNPDNYQGRWTQEEEDQLVALIQEHGRKFKTISKIINRTPLNIKDKLKSMGDENYLLRNSNWMINEVVHFLRLLAKYQKCEFIKEDWEEILIQTFGESWQSQFLKTAIQRKKFKQYKVLLDEDSIRKVLLIVNYEIFQQMDKEKIPWSKIAAKIKTKSKDDLRNYWNQQLQFWALFFNTVDENKLIEDIILQDPQDEEDIDFTKVLRKTNLSLDQKVAAWQKLKNRIQGRDKLDLEKILQQIYKEAKQPQLETSRIQKSTRHDILEEFRQLKKAFVTPKSIQNHDPVSHQLNLLKQSSKDPFSLKSHKMNYFNLPYQAYFYPTPYWMPVYQYPQEIQTLTQVLPQLQSQTSQLPCHLAKLPDSQSTDEFSLPSIHSQNSEASEISIPMRKKKPAKTIQKNKVQFEKESKNIQKNYAKAITNYISKNKCILNNLLPEQDHEEFLNLMKSLKSKLQNVCHISQHTSNNDFIRVFRILGYPLFINISSQKLLFKEQVYVVHLQFQNPEEKLTFEEQKIDLTQPIEMLNRKIIS